MTVLLAINQPTPYGGGLRQLTLYKYIYIYLDTSWHRSKVDYFMLLFIWRVSALLIKNFEVSREVVGNISHLNLSGTV